jgi:spectinomycin phosphotransferase
MLGRPEGVTDQEVRAVLAHGWGLRPARIRYAPLGAGSYHWVADRFFVTVDDLDDKPWLGSQRDEVLAGLRAAMETARAVAAIPLTVAPFVVAPLLAGSGSAVERLGERYAVTVFSYLDGTAGEFGAYRTARERAEVLDMLAALHTVSLPVVPSRPIALPGRDDLEAALDHPSGVSGPYAEEVRVLLAATGAGPRIRDLLATFDRLAAAADALPRVITHGEPHPGNVIRTAARPMLIDWDTVGLAPPERDLWFLAGSGVPADFDQYETVTGYRPAPGALELYRLRWRLDDIAAYLTELRRARHPTPDLTQALRTLQHLTAP